MNCKTCGQPRLTYEGTGHRMAGYPFREVTIATDYGCKCSNPDFTVDLPSPEKVAATKAKLAIRIDASVNKYIAENGASIIDRWCRNNLDRVYWMTDAQWEHIEKERAR